MNKVGDILRENRLLKNLSIEEIANELKISKYVLLKIENDEIKFDKDLVFYIGHIRSYSDYMDLETSQIIDTFKKQISYNLIVPDKISKPSFNINILNFQKIFSGSLILVIFFTFYFLFVNEDEKKINYALVPDLPESLVPIIEEANLDIITNNNLENKIESHDYLGDINNSSAIASLSSNNKNISEEIITLKLLNPTWIQIRDKKENIIISKLMDKDEEYSYNMNLEYNITAGNAGNIIVLIDNNVRGKIGKYGEVIDSLILDSNFNK